MLKTILKALLAIIQHLKLLIKLYAEKCIILLNNIGFYNLVITVMIYSSTVHLPNSEKSTRVLVTNNDYWINQFIIY